MQRKKKDCFEFCGETGAEVDKVKKRIHALLSGSLAQELNATKEELISANLTSELILANLAAKDHNNGNNSSASPKLTSIDDNGRANAEA
jgi:hypothetical protein